MSQLVYLCYPSLLIFLFWGAKVYGRREWNEDFLSLSQTKALQGFCAISIMLHHIGQKTCASWLKPDIIVHGLELFVPIGYFFVAIFLFCSGYGLYKSYKEKENYFQGYFNRRALPLLIVYILTHFIFLLAQDIMGGKLSSLQRLGLLPANPYAWYVLALLYLYLIFYLVFKHCRNERVAVVLLFALVIGYIVYCDWLVYGGWWYNAVILFPLGLLVARHEDAIRKEVKKRYVLYLLLALLALPGFYLLSNHTAGILRHLGIPAPNELRRWIGLLAQMAAATSFTILTFLLGMKVRIGNKALAFMGTITLEFYLIHGLFVQLFSSNFISNKTPPLYYVRNVAFLVCIVLILAIPTAVLLQKINRWLVRNLVKKRVLVKAILKEIKKVALILAGIAAVITVVLCIRSHTERHKMRETVESYEEDNITFANVEGKKMAATIRGEGKHTIVVLRGVYDPCPTVTLIPFADALSKKNRVITFDYLGSGFSDATSKPRTADRICYEIHTALQSLGEKGPYILLAHDVSGIYAQRYAELYPKELEAVVGIDTSVGAMPDRIMAEEAISLDDFTREMKKSAREQYLRQQVLSTTGYIELQWSMLESVFLTGYTQKELLVLKEMFIKQNYSKEIVDEMARYYESCKLVQGRKYDPALPVLLLLTEATCRDQQYETFNWKQMHEELITSSPHQKVVVIPGNIDIPYLNPLGLQNIIQPTIDSLDKGTVQQQ